MNKLKFILKRYISLPRIYRLKEVIMIRWGDYEWLIRK